MIDAEHSCLHIPVGPECNNNCIFCNEPRDTRRKINSEFTLERVTRLLDEHRAAIDHVNLTSGEPLLVKDICRIVAAARDRGYAQISVTTNGRMLAYGRLARELIDSGVTRFNVSIHGHLPRVHDALTRTKGSFEQTTAGLRNITALAKRYPIKVLALITLNRLNLEHFGDVLELVQGHGVDESVFNVVQPVQQNMGRYFDRVMPRYTEIVAAVERYYADNAERFETVTDSGPRRVVSIIDLPLCLSPALIRFLGCGENRIIEDIEYPECIPQGVRRQRLIRDNQGDKVKRARCGDCVFAARCNGIYQMYIERRGWDEFSPVARPASAEPPPASTGER